MVDSVRSLLGTGSEKKGKQTGETRQNDMIDLAKRHGRLLPVNRAAKTWECFMHATLRKRRNMIGIVFRER
jgi:hypothetical protein